MIHLYPKRSSTWSTRILYKTNQNTDASLIGLSTGVFNHKPPLDITGFPRWRTYFFNALGNWWGKSFHGFLVQTMQLSLIIHHYHFLVNKSGFRGKSEISSIHFWSISSGKERWIQNNLIVNFHLSQLYLFCTNTIRGELFLIIQYLKFRMRLDRAYIVKPYNFHSSLSI